MSRITLSVFQIKQLAELAGLVIKPYPIDADDKEAEITITTCPKDGVKEEDGSIGHYSHIAYFEDYPDEGVLPLGEKHAKGEE